MNSQFIESALACYDLSSVMMTTEFAREPPRLLQKSEPLNFGTIVWITSINNGTLGPLPNSPFLLNSPSYCVVYPLYIPSTS